jgi:hypothetical protein
MKCKALFALRLLLGLVVVAIGNGQTGGLGLVFQQIEAIGPRQWLSLMAGTIVPIAAVSPRTAHGLTGEPVSLGGRAPGSQTTA